MAHFPLIESSSHKLTRCVSAATAAPCLDLHRLPLFGIAVSGLPARLIPVFCCSTHTPAPFRGTTHTRAYLLPCAQRIWTVETKDRKTQNALGCLGPLRLVTFPHWCLRRPNEFHRRFIAPWKPACAHPWLDPGAGLPGTIFALDTRHIRAPWPSTVCLYRLESSITSISPGHAVLRKPLPRYYYYYYHFPHQANSRYRR